MEQLHARNVVIGSGAMGAATAYHLAKRGEPVLLLEQFPLGHDRGSSHGAARITRHSYADPRYARLMLDAFRAWKTLEADAGQNLYLRTGGLSFCLRGRLRLPGCGQLAGHRNSPSPDVGARAPACLPRLRGSGQLRRRLRTRRRFTRRRACDALQLELARHFGGPNDDPRRVPGPLDRSRWEQADRLDQRPPDHRRSPDRNGRGLDGPPPPPPPGPTPAHPPASPLFSAPDPARFVPGRFPVFIHKGPTPRMTLRDARL